MNFFANQPAGYNAMNTKSSPQLLLLDGATGAGKSSLLNYLREEYSRGVFVGSKLTTRPKRIGDNDWEFGFVTEIPERNAAYSFNSVGNRYAVNQDELSHTISRGLTYGITCVNRTTMEALKSDFDTLLIYVYRLWTAADLEGLLVSRGDTDGSASGLRRDEVASIASQYLEKIELYDHVLLNVGSKTNLLDQFSAILSWHGINRESATDRAGISR